MIAPSPMGTSVRLLSTVRGRGGDDEGPPRDSRLKDATTNGRIGEPASSWKDTAAVDCPGTTVADGCFEGSMGLQVPEKRPEPRAFRAGSQQTEASTTVLLARGSNTDRVPCGSARKSLIMRTIMDLVQHPTTVPRRPIRARGVGAESGKGSLQLSIDKETATVLLFGRCRCNRLQVARKTSFPEKESAIESVGSAFLFEP